MAKRANGEGSYIHIVPTKCEKCKSFKTCEKRTDSSSKCWKRDRSDHWEYYYQVRNIKGGTTRKKLQAKTRKELAKRVEQMRTVNDEVGNDTITVGQWCDRWTSAVLPSTVKQSTLTNYKALLSYIPDNVRKKKLSKLAPIDLQQMLTELREHGSKANGGRLSSKTVDSVRRTLITCLQYAVDSDVIKKNVG